MMLSEYKQRISQWGGILKLNIINTFQIEGASIFNKWTGVLSTIFYNVTFLLFVDVLFSNIRSLGGYERDQMLFMLLVVEFHVFLIYMWSTQNIETMIDSVNTGSLDMVLTKPMPALFYISLRKLSIVNFLRDGIPPFIIISTVINWGNVGLQVHLIPAGIAVFFLGQVAFHALHFLTALPVFWFGQSAQLQGVLMALEDTTKIPFEGYNRGFKAVFTLLLPTLIAAQVSTSVMLGKTNPATAVFVAFGIAMGFMAAKIVMWKIALKNYTSASS